MSDEEQLYERVPYKAAVVSDLEVKRGTDMPFYIRPCRPEWVPVSEPPGEDGCYAVVVLNGYPETSSFGKRTPDTPPEWYASNVTHYLPIRLPDPPEEQSAVDEAWEDYLLNLPDSPTAEKTFRAGYEAAGRGGA